MAAQQKDEAFSRRYRPTGARLERVGNGYNVAPFLAAVLIGIVQAYLLVLLWGYISINTPLPHGLHTLGLRGSALRAVVFCCDALCDVLFSLPAAYAVCRLRPPRLLVYLSLALAPGFIWQYQLFFVDPRLFLNWALFGPGLLLTLLPLPLAALVIRRVLARHSPDQRLERP